MNKEEFLNNLSKYEITADLSTEDAIDMIGTIIDLSYDFQIQEGIEKAFALISEIRCRELLEIQQGIIFYFEANAWENKRRIINSCDDDNWHWERTEYEKTIINLRMAANKLKNHLKDDYSKLRYCQILTNLGNQLDFLGRVICSIDYYENALKVNSNHNMSVGNLGICLYTYAMLLYDKGHSLVLFSFSKKYLLQALKGQLEFGAKEYFEKYLNFLEKVLPGNYILPNLEEYDLGDSDEKAYRLWVLENKLFLKSSK